MLDQAKITIIVEKLVEAYHPRRIYLFGSYAWGEPTIDSDLDLLIIVASSEEKPYRRMKPAYQALRGMKVSKDILVYTEAEFENYAGEPASLFYKIKNEGVKLFEAA
jgi:predicted nucleotidyltransferase